MIEPARNLLIIRPLAGSDKKGSLYVPEAAQEALGVAEVLAVGPGLRYNDQVIPTGYSVGDEVVYIPPQSVAHPALEKGTYFIEAELILGIRKR